MSKCIIAIIGVMLLGVAPVQAAGKWVLINTDLAGTRLYEDRGSTHWHQDGTTLAFRVLYDYSNLSRSIVEDVEMPCLQEGPHYVATITAVSVYTGRMGTGKRSLSDDTLPEAADERSAKQFNNLICDAKD